ncbi:hypothetical protein HDU82_001111, partial [Entophlyctis luteolus]
MSTLSRHPAQPRHRSDKSGPSETSLGFAPFSITHLTPLCKPLPPSRKVVAQPALAHRHTPPKTQHPATQQLKSRPKPSKSLTGSVSPRTGIYSPPNAFELGKSAHASAAAEPTLPPPPDATRGSQIPGETSRAIAGSQLLAPPTLPPSFRARTAAPHTATPSSGRARLWGSVATRAQRPATAVAAPSPPLILWEEFGQCSPSAGDVDHGEKLSALDEPGPWRDCPDDAFSEHTASVAYAVDPQGPDGAVISSRQASANDKRRSSRA